MGLLDNLFNPNKKIVSSASVAPGDVLSEKESVDKFSEGLVDVKDIIAPSAIEVDFNHILIGTKFFRTYFATGYPRFVGANWLSPVINFEKPLDISTFYYPVDSALIMSRLERKIAELEATINIATDDGKPVDPEVKVALKDALELQNQIAAGEEKFFHFALYLTVRAETLEELEKIGKNLESTMAAMGVVIKMATLQQEQGLQSTIPTAMDKIYFTRNMDTTSIATTFPFVSSELTMIDGVLYGINKHNKSLVIFDRFRMANANMTVFATSGAGKSYMIKLEAIRSLMFGIDVIIIDPEKEYEKLATAAGGEYISFTQDGAAKLNPFELSGVYNIEEDELRYKILSLHGLLRLMMGGQLTPEEDAILDRGLVLTYSEKGITPDPATHQKEAPLLEDLYKILRAMGEVQADTMATKLEKYIQGSAAGVFNKKTTIDLKNSFTVFSIRDLSDELRPIAMYMMLEYIWTKVKKVRKKRILIIDEAWWMMQHADAAQFLFSLAKRARKYGLGLTTITQDVEDFLALDYGKAIVTNSSMQMLLKQSPAAVERLKEVFHLTEGESRYIMAAGIGEGILFAGDNHAAIQVIASENEHNLITTNINDEPVSTLPVEAPIAGPIVAQPVPEAPTPIVPASVASPVAENTVPQSTVIPPENPSQG
jgi:conjugal transfer ATP-binding protein TraC